MNDTGAQYRGKTDYLFVNNIRFFSMLAIIAVHSEFFPWQMSGGLSINAVLLQVFKFGTQCFFLISGFLLGDKLATAAPWAYFQRRLSVTVRPWLFWSALSLLLLFAIDLLRGKSLILNAWPNLMGTLFYSNYWFVPNFMLALALLLVFRRFFDRLWFGVVLAALSVGYGLNLYGHWLPTQHTTALLGFVLYLWLGMQANRHRAALTRLVGRTPWAALAALVLLSGGLATWEANRLFRLGNEDFLNTLRLSNQLYSLAVFALLLKVPGRMSPRWMNVREHTFGLYLTHWIVMMIAFKGATLVFSRLLGVPRDAFSEAPQRYLPAEGLHFLMWLGFFVLIYGTAFLLTRALARSPRAALVGVRRPPAVPVEAGPATPVPEPAVQAP